jgi:hypothetical protein
MSMLVPVRLSVQQTSSACMEVYKIVFRDVNCAVDRMNGWWCFLCFGRIHDVFWRRRAFISIAGCIALVTAEPDI